jgi:hypothetical protein
MAHSVCGEGLRGRVNDVARRPHAVTTRGDWIAQAAFAWRLAALQREYLFGELLAAYSLSKSSNATQHLPFHLPERSDELFRFRVALHSPAGHAFLQERYDRADCTA